MTVSCNSVVKQAAQTQANIPVAGRAPEQAFCVLNGIHYSFIIYATKAFQTESGFIPFYAAKNKFVKTPK